MHRSNVCCKKYTVLKKHSLKKHTGSWVHSVINCKLILSWFDRYILNRHRWLSAFIRQRFIKPKFLSWLAALCTSCCHILHYKNAQHTSPGMPALFVTQSATTSCAYTSRSTEEFRIKPFHPAFYQNNQISK